RIKSIYKKSVTNLLLVGLCMFALMWLNLHNISRLLGKDFMGIESVIFLMGIGKLIDLGTGANSQIIGTSSYWKVDFTTNVIYTLVALPLNYYLISHFGLMGAAYSNLISLTFYNLLRFGFLWKKFSMQPYTWKDLLAVVVTAALVLLVRFIPVMNNFIVDAAIRSIAFIGLFAGAVYWLKISEAANELADKYLRLKN
ncbi:MAG TPA: oligosaccharide flippase family protein, partial [Flavihumibacter sp.]|nr:oligosaccharide flippase family protein [Flavihumibacter sp.]